MVCLSAGTDVLNTRRPASVLVIVDGIQHRHQPGARCKQVVVGVRPYLEQGAATGHGLATLHDVGSVGTNGLDPMPPPAAIIDDNQTLPAVQPTTLPAVNGQRVNGSTSHWHR